MSRMRAAVRCGAALVVLLLVVLGAPPATAQPPPPPPPVATPDTSACPYRAAPPPAVDLSEVPLAGAAAPEPLPLPDDPIGGERMGECGHVLPDGAPPLPPEVFATSWLLADLGTGDVLAAKDPHARHRPASTIKLLTALVAVDALAPDRLVTGDASDGAQEGSAAGIGAGGVYSVWQLLAGLLLASGNDTAHALARELGGAPAAAGAMNARAEALGALDTRAATPSGLDAPGTSTSAYDLALVLRAALRTPLIADLLRTPQIDFPGYPGLPGDVPKPGFVLGNGNRLLANYPGALGGKTGYTTDARHTFAGAAERDGRRLGVVLLRGEQQPVPMWEQAARLLDYGFALPPGTAVGGLVDGPPEEPTPTPTPTAPAAEPPTGTDEAEPAAARPAAAAEPSPGGGATPVAAATGAGAALAAAALAAVVLRARRRRES